MKRVVCAVLALLTGLCILSSCGKQGANTDGTTVSPEQSATRTTVPRVPNQEVDTNRPSPSIQNNTADQPQQTRNPNAASPATPDVVKPVQDEALNLDTDTDISSANMKFLYDETGRITDCEYMTGGMLMRLEYSYPVDGSIAIFGFYDGSMVIDITYFPTRGFDPALGFTAYDGFYFFGYDFSA